jgi:transposase-like protein
MHLYRAIDKSGATVEFLFSKTRNLEDAKRFFRKAFVRYRLPTQITIDGSQTNLEAARVSHGVKRMLTQSTAKPLIIRRSRYLNNRIEQDHRRIKRRTRPMLGFKSTTTASVIFGGIELIYMLRKAQMVHVDTARMSVADQFDVLAA